MSTHRRASTVRSTLLRCVLGATVVLIGAQSTSPEDAVECGVSRAVAPHVINGTDAIPHEFPWQVYLKVYDSRWFWSSTRLCGGSLIDNEWIVTAAHCLNDAYEIDVSLGKHNVKIVEDGQVVQRTAHLFRHPLFDASTLDYDIGLVRLSGRLDFTKHRYIAPICLPSKNDFTSFDNQTCVASGWGRLSSQHNELAEVLQKVYVRVLSAHNTPSEGITPRMIRASATHRGKVYYGDSGGPLQCLRKGRYVLAGDVSFGSSGDFDLTAGYGRVSEMVDWINETRKKAA